MRKSSIKQIRIKDWVIEPSLNKLSQQNNAVRIEPLAMDVLVSLCKQPHMVVSTEKLLSQFWSGKTTTGRLVSKRVSLLRKVLGDDARAPTYIKTVPKSGYVLVVDAEIELHEQFAPKFAEPAPTNEEGLTAPNYYDAIRHIGNHDHFERWSEKVISQLYASLTHEPSLPNVWGMLALIHVKRAVWLPDSHCFHLADGFADKALQINDETAAALTAKVYISMLRDWDIKSAKIWMNRALLVAPGEVGVVHAESLLLRLENNASKIIENVQLFRALTKNDAVELPELIRLYVELRLYDKAIEESERAGALMPGFASLPVAFALHQVGRFEDSIRVRLSFYSQYNDRFKSLYYACSKGWEARKYEGAMDELSVQLNDLQLNTGRVDLLHDIYWTADEQFALEHLKKDLADRRPWLVGMCHSPTFDTLRHLPEFEYALSILSETLPRYESSATQLDIARLEIFKGDAVRAMQALQSLTELEKTPHASRYCESLAWGHFAVSDYNSAIQLGQKVLNLESTTKYQASMACLIQSVSYKYLRNPQAAKVLFESALNFWPGKFDEQLCIRPLFYRGDQELYYRFLQGLPR